MATPVRIACFYHERDFQFLHSLRKQLIALDLEIWGLDQIPGGAVTSAEIDAHLWNDEILVFLVSADLLAMREAHAWMDVARRRSLAGGAVLPVIVRPSHWEGSPLQGLQPLPRDGRALSTVPTSTREEALFFIAQELATAAKYRSPRSSDSGPRHTQASTPPAARPLSDIFPIYVDVNLAELLGFATLVQPAQYRQIVSLLRVRGQGLVIEGPSGSGKSVAVRQALSELGETQARWFKCTDAQQQEELERCLDERTTGFLIIDDFHYLDRPRQEAVARRIQVGDARTKFVLIGVNEVRTSLVQGLPDLGRRLMAVQMNRQPDDKVAELIAKGEEAANIDFLQRASFIATAAGSLFLAQNLCFFAADAAGVTETQAVAKPITCDARQAMGPLMDSFRSEFHRHLEVLVRVDEQFPPRGAGLVLLWLLGKQGRSRCDLETARDRYPGLSAAFDWLRAQMAPAIARIDHLSRYLHLDESAGILTCQDPRFEFYLKHLDWAELIQDTGHLHLRIAARAGELEIVHSAPAASQQSTAQGTPAGLPRTLVDAHRQGHLIPFAGAGVSMAVHDRQRQDLPDPRLFPSWAGLLDEAADRLAQDGLEGDAMAVRGALRKRNPSYLDAARAAQEGLGSNFYRLLTERFDPPFDAVDPATLALPRALWALGSQLLITSNYDRVLQWACPAPLQGDLQRWNVQAPGGMQAMLRDGIHRPTVWHLHGHVEDVTQLVLTPDGYSRLYASEASDGEERYDAALASLRILLASRTFLFVGFSLSDESFGDQLRWASEVFGDTAGPHFVILREFEKATAEERLRQLGISSILRILTVPALGPPLLDLLQRIAAAG